jgi:hypothetical protein
MENQDTNMPEATNEAVLMAFTNDKSPEHLGVLQGLLKMFYHATLTNRIGIMEAMNTETGEPEVVLVGIEQNGDNISAYPLASLINAEAVTKYEAPDGQGGWLVNKTEVAA